MFLFQRIGIFIAAVAVKFEKACGILGEVGRHPVEDDGNAVLMENVDHFHELSGSAIAGGGGIIAYYLISP